MALKQSRRGVSLSHAAYSAAVQHANASGRTLSALVTDALRAYGVEIPGTEHQTVERAEKAVNARLEVRLG